MNRSLDEILDIILHTSEIFEEEMKRNSDIKSLTTRQLNCIEIIKRKSCLGISGLASALNISKASASVMINRLEKNGYVYKLVSQKDRRTSGIHLTEKGEKAARLHQDLHNKIAALLIGDMTDSEKDILMVLLNKSIISLENNSKKLNNS